MQFFVILNLTCTSTSSFLSVQLNSFFFCFKRKKNQTEYLMIVQPLRLKVIFGKNLFKISKYDLLYLLGISNLNK